MEKAIEIKRRAQRCIQNGDLDGALNEYEKLVGSDDSDPYNYVLLADLLYKKGEHGPASQRYLSAVSAYEKAALYKNAIAVCKKMLRLSLSAAQVAKQLASLHALDGLSSEAALYYVQYAEFMVRANEPLEAADALRRAYDSAPENVKVLEQLAEAWLLAGENDRAHETLKEAAVAYRGRGLTLEAQRVETRLRGQSGLMPTVSAETAPPPIDVAPAVPAARVTAEPSPTAAPHAIEVPRSLHDLLEPGRVDFDANAAAAATPAPATFDLEPGIRSFEPTSAPPEPVAEAVAEPEESPVYEIDAPLETPSASGMLAVPETLAVPEALQPVDEPVAEEPAESTTWDLEDAPSVEEAVAAVGPDDEGDGVYEISEEDAGTSYEAAERTLEEIAHVTPAAPAVQFGAAEAFPAEEPAAEALPSLADVEHLLASAQDHFRAGDRVLAGDLLARAASAYESLGRWDSAATIYRSLGRSPQTPPAVLAQWLANCEKRQDRMEAAQVACELGDRALNEGDEVGARSWFERARAFDAENETASRRLSRLSGGSAGAAVETAVAPAWSASTDAPEGGRVEVAVGRGEAVTFDLGSLLAEFQRGVEAQLSGDAQSHYDLGMTYREMGLLEQAVDSFRVAAQSAPLAARAHEMIGRCFADQSRLSDAILEFRAALTQLGDSAELAVDLHHELGCALEASGQSHEAIAHFEKVLAVHPDFADAAQRLEALRRREAA